MIAEKGGKFTSISLATLFGAASSSCSFAALAAARALVLKGVSFVSDWKMVWEEILIGFTVAGFVAVLVLTGVWESIFLIGACGDLPDWLIALENAAIVPFVAAMTFIGSMGNIPIATVLNANGVLFAGIMGFIYSDLMVPPLVMINAKYYGWRVALYIATVMYVSNVATALILNYLFGALGIIPENGRKVADVAQFSFDYTFYLNVVFIGLAAGLFWLHRQHHREAHMDHKMNMKGGVGLKRIIALLFLAVLLVGLVVFLVTNR
jgi:hypothetical protein